MRHQDEENNRREGDVNISFLGFTFKGPVKSLISLLNGTVGVLALVAVVVYHHYTNDAVLKAIHEAIWVQTWTLATPQEERIPLLQRNASKLPEAVREKVERRKFQGEP